MYIPDLYRTDDKEWPVRILEENPLGLLTTHASSSAPPFATHLPVIIPSGSRDALLQDEKWRGATLLGHMNRANPHWQSLADGTPARIVFQGPGAYVSPSVYHTDPAAPTWDFTAVHVQGTLWPVRDEAETLAIVTATATELERKFGTGWCPHSSTEYFRQLLAGVGAFELRVDTMDAMFKLSQEKSHEIRNGVVDWFVQGQHGRSRELASLMAEFYKDDRGTGA